jgi:hypothetical protein
VRWFESRCRTGACVVGGTSLPGVLTAGTFYQAGEGWMSYDVHDPERTVVLELEHETYRRLVVEVEDPAAVVATLEAAIAGRSA